ncbi:glycosyl hydrolase family 43 [Salegentibacter salinarum]|uniref:Glycosyl hydrolase family 43 n=1 Tax=Salegentibacter salinarum TaxID=447422 RepID=A0A2N0TWE9_9FLAO|nr:glycoside hydrolase family 43 protein [Salegentibacter salinarum]PKD19077.1 glycosyl hydrolase family 43 [Salegentibacter salinarum]SKB95761.1 Beta-xylosidase, GH43 family [Salegentibacter salinarum]
MNTEHQYIIGLLFILMFANCFSQSKTFTNPLLPSGADPYSTYYNGYYYYTHTLQDKLVLWKTKNLANIAAAESKIIWTPPEGTMYSKDIWAPEFHIIDNKWYVYFAADDGNNENHRMYVLENDNEDPFQGEWDFKGKVAAWPDRWAIDGNVFTYEDERYMIWSGWEGHTNGQQNIYIAKMKNPWTIEGKRVLISEPTYVWEKQGDLDDEENPPHVNVNEGPQYLEHNGEIFIVYSANGCWTDYYSLGLLSFKGEDILDPGSWIKHNKPIFKKSEENSVYAPGHNSFFKSPDDSEDWILYHANSRPGEGCGTRRSPRMQKIKWNEDGTPNLGTPVSAKTILEIPTLK